MKKIGENTILKRSRLFMKCVALTVIKYELLKHPRPSANVFLRSFVFSFWFSKRDLAQNAA